MKITSAELRKIIKEEVARAVQEQEVSEGFVDKAKEYAEIFKQQLQKQGLAVGVAGTLALSLATALKAGGSEVDPVQLMTMLASAATAAKAAMDIEKTTRRAPSPMDQIGPDIET